MNELRGTPAFDGPQGAADERIARFLALTVVADSDVGLLRFGIDRVLSIIFGQAMNQETADIFGYLFLGRRLDYLPSPVQMTVAAKRAGAVLQRFADSLLAEQLEVALAIEALSVRFPEITDAEVTSLKRRIERARFRIDWIDHLLNDSVAVAAKMSTERGLKPDEARRQRVAGLGRGLRQSLDLARAAHLGESPAPDTDNPYRHVTPVIFNREHLESFDKERPPLRIDGLILRDGIHAYGESEGPARAWEVHREVLLLQHVLVVGAVISAARGVAEPPRSGLLRLADGVRRRLDGPRGTAVVTPSNHHSSLVVETPQRSAEDELWQIFFDALGTDAAAHLRVGGPCAGWLDGVTLPALPAPAPRI